MGGTENDEIYWDEDSDSLEDTVIQKLKNMILLLLTMAKSSWPSVMRKYHEFVTGT